MRGFVAGLCHIIIKAWRDGHLLYAFESSICKLHWILSRIIEMNWNISFGIWKHIHKMSWNKMHGVMHHFFHSLIAAFSLCLMLLHWHCIWCAYKDHCEPRNRACAIMRDKLLRHIFIHRVSVDEVVDERNEDVWRILEGIKLEWSFILYCSAYGGKLLMIRGFLGLLLGNALLDLRYRVLELRIGIRIYDPPMSHLKAMWFMIYLLDVLNWELMIMGLAFRVSDLGFMIYWHLASRKSYIVCGGIYN
jgi:hypothetical protein